MKFSIDGKEICSLSEFQEQIIYYCTAESELYEYMEHSISSMTANLYKSSFDQLINDWIPIMAQRYDMLPTNQDVLIKMIFSQPDYKPKQPSSDKVKE